MDISSLPIKEAVVTPNTQAKPEERQPLYWFENERGVAFPTQENEAWNILKKRVKVLNQDIRFKYLGMSTGQVYWEGVKQSPQILKEHGQEKVSEFIRDLEKQELATANPNIRPRNMDCTDLGGNPTTADLGGIRL
jgi:GTP-dependent phosphoenolpyruvate carboxykinase